MCLFEQFKYYDHYVYLYRACYERKWRYIEFKFGLEKN